MLKIVLAVILLVVVVYFGFTCTVREGDCSIILRFGAPRGDAITEPGLYFKLPWPFETVYTYDSRLQYFESGDVERLTNDSRNLTFNFFAFWSVEYALHVNDVSSMVNACVSNAMVEVSAKTHVDNILTSGKAEFIREVSELSQKKFDAAGMGITLQNLEFVHVSMPEEVREIYESVNSATVSASTLIEQAKQYENTTIPQAQSTANSMISSANIQYSLNMSGAETALAEFWGILEEFEADPDSVKDRVFNEKMAQALKNIGTVRLVDGDGSKIFIDWGAK